MPINLRSFLQGLAKSAPDVAQLIVQKKVYDAVDAQKSVITSNDASLVARHALGFITLNSFQTSLADVDINGNIQLYDASLIARSAAGFTQTIGQSKQWISTPKNYTGRSV